VSLVEGSALRTAVVRRAGSSRVCRYDCNSSSKTCRYLRRGHERASSRRWDPMDPVSATRLRTVVGVVPMLVIFIRSSRISCALSTPQVYDRPTEVDHVQ
jgi:hypothetical protein